MVIKQKADDPTLDDASSTSKPTSEQLSAQHKSHTFKSIDLPSSKLNKLKTNLNKLISSSDNRLVRADEDSNKTCANKRLQIENSYLKIKKLNKKSSHTTNSNTPSLVLLRNSTSSLDENYIINYNSYQSKPNGKRDEFNSVYDADEDEEIIGVGSSLSNTSLSSHSNENSPKLELNLNNSAESKCKQANFTITSSSLSSKSERESLSSTSPLSSGFSIKNVNNSSDLISSLKEDEDSAVGSTNATNDHDVELSFNETNNQTLPCLSFSDDDSTTRRETITFNKIKFNEDADTDADLNDLIRSNEHKSTSLAKNSESEDELTLNPPNNASDVEIKEFNDKLASSSSFKRPSKISSGTSTISSSSSLYLACEVASLSSLTSNYSQFDFLNSQNSNLSTSPAANQQPASNTSNGLTSFFFSNGLFGNKKAKSGDLKEEKSGAELKAHSQIKPDSSIPVCTQQNNTPTKTLDLIASKLFNLKPAASKNSFSVSASKPKSGQSLKQTCESETNENGGSASPDNASIKTNYSFNNLCNITSTQAPSTVLIFENRPSNLPAKSQQEALKHKQEYERMVEIAKKKEQKEKEIQMKKHEQQMKKEDFMANSLKLWNTEILVNWNELKNAKRTHQLWWHGLPPSIRGKVWKLAIGNELNLTKESYYFYEKKAKQKLDYLKHNQGLDQSFDLSESKNGEKSDESSVELIKLDVSRTFPQLSFFQEDGPYHQALHSVLGAYACYNTKIGYVQGMSFLTAILLLNMEASDAFICLANLLNTKYLVACFCMDQAKMNRYFRVHQILFEHNIPKLYNHFEEQKVKPDLYLIEWIFTLFSKSLPLDVMSRVWDVFFRDKEEFLFRTALGILNMYKETLLKLDFEHIVQFLTKLPENINSTQLFKSIEQIHTSIDDCYFSFESLIADVTTTPSSLATRNCS